METLIALIIVLAVAFLIVWAIQAYLTMIPQHVRNLLCFLVVIFAVLGLFGYWHGGHTLLH